MICPFCGETVIRAEFSSSAGERAETLCCYMPIEFIDHYDMFAKLPGGLFSVAIAARKAEYAAMNEQDHENARRFRESRDKWFATHGHLFKEESCR